MKLSARRRLDGEVAGIEAGAVNGTVRIHVGCDDHERRSRGPPARRRIGAYAVIKSSDVMVGVDWRPSDGGQTRRPEVVRSTVTSRP